MITCIIMVICMATAVAIWLCVENLCRLLILTQLIYRNSFPGVIVAKCEHFTKNFHTRRMLSLSDDFRALIIHTFLEVSDISLSFVPVTPNPLVFEL